MKIETIKCIYQKLKVSICILLLSLFMSLFYTPAYAQEVDINTLVNTIVNKVAQAKDRDGLSYINQLNIEWKALGLEAKGDKYYALFSYVQELGRVHSNVVLTPSYHDYANLVLPDGLVASNIESYAESAMKKLKNLKDKGFITDSEFAIQQQKLLNMIHTGADKVIDEINKSGNNDDDKRKKIDKVQLAVLKTANACQKIVNDNTCSTVEELKLKYQSGCYSCFIVGNLISTFLDVAGKVYPTSQKAGLVVLLIGTLIWLAMWGLKNVSSLTQIDGGNILNELIKFSFKVLLAYVFITAGISVVGKYIINPIMGTGAVIAQQFWDEKIKASTYDFEWGNDVFISDDSPLVKQTEKAMKEQAKENPPEVQQTPIPPKEDTIPAEQVEPIDPNSSDEQIVIALQKAFLNMLKKQLGEITNSCKGPCGTCSSTSRETPKHNSNYTGHISYVKTLFCWASGKEGTNCGHAAYCQASISAAMAKMLAEVTGDTKNNAFKKLHILNGVVAHPLAWNKDDGKNHKTAGVWICQSGRPAVTLNPGDVIGINGKRGKEGQGFGQSSGHHSVTIVDPGKPSFISFNGDTFGNNLCTYYGADPHGKIYRVSEKWRNVLKANPNLKKELKLNRLAELGAGINMSFINYTGGDIAGGSDSGGQSIIEIPQFEYKATTAAKAIMSESVIDSILGATKVITDTLAENMVLGNALTCYSTLDKGGAWHTNIKIIGKVFITNWFLWLEGAIIWVAGFLLTMAVAYYLLDVCYKIGFAVIALPIVVGLWPFEMTKKKFSACISIIAKSAATFAFLAMTTSYGMKLISSVLSGGENAMGLEKIYEAIDAASDANAEAGDENVQYVKTHMDLFSVNFVLLMFAIIYTFKLVGGTVQMLVNKFFPDNVFGNQQPMHGHLKAATEAVHKLAMKPVGMARDIAITQTVKVAMHPIKTARRAARGVKKGWNGVKKGWNGIKNAFK